MNDNYYSWDNSKCLRGHLHKWKIVETYRKHVRERCEYCRQDMIFSTAPGRNTSLKYLSYHIRSALTPNHNLFYFEYPHLKNKKITNE